MAGFWSGSFTDYGTAVGTVGLAVIATAVAIREAGERRTLRAERDEARAQTAKIEGADREAAARQQRRSLALSVSGYLDNVPYDPLLVTLQPGQPAIGNASMEGHIRQCAVVRNLSNAPITKVEIYWQDARNGPVDDVSVVPADLLDVVPPLGFRAYTRPTALGDDWGNRLALLIKFTDANGLRWARRDDGRLYMITQDGKLGDLESP